MNKRIKKNAFTLIELLAVILILGIIALIAIPTVNKVLEEARIGAFKSTLNNITKKVEETCNLEVIKGKEVTPSYTISNGKPTPDLELKGDLPNGTIIVDKDCKTKFNLTNGSYVGTKDEIDGDIVISKNEEETLIDKDTDPTKSYARYYADIDADGTVDGIIFADLITGNTGDGQWDEMDGDYNIPKINPNDVKYYVIGENYNGIFGSKPVIKPAKNTSGEDRFYILALTDFENKLFSWYGAASSNSMNDFATYTSEAFGSGLENSNKMLEKWENDGYGEKNKYDSLSPDLWGEIEDEIQKEWFLPSREEWAAIGGEIIEKLQINYDNFTDYGFNNCYWTSSQSDKINVYNANIEDGCIYFYNTTDFAYRVRLIKTF